MQRRDQRRDDADAQPAQPAADLEHEQRRPAATAIWARPTTTQSGRTASRARRGTTRRAAACTPTAPRGGSRTSRSRRAPARSGRSSRRTPRGSRSRSMREHGEAREGRGGRDERRMACRRRISRVILERGWRALGNRSQSSHATSRGFSTTACGKVPELRPESPRRFCGHLARSAARRERRRKRGALARADARARRPGPCRTPHPLDCSRSRPAVDRGRHRGPRAARGRVAALGRASRRPPSAEVAGTRTATSRPLAPRSATSTARRARTAPRASRTAAAGPSSAPRRSSAPSRATLLVVPTTHSLGELAPPRGAAGADRGHGRARLLPRHGPARRPPAPCPRRSPRRSRAPSPRRRGRRGRGGAPAAPRRCHLGSRRARRDRRRPGVESRRADCASGADRAARRE